MTAPHTSPLQLPAWQQLATLAATAQPHLRDELAAEPDRAQRLSASAAGITLDASRQRISPPIQSALLALAEQAGVAAHRDAMFRGEPINQTEKRPVLHVALRGDPRQAGPWGAVVQADVQRELDRVCAFAESLRAGQVLGHTGEAITDVVNIGIGGSDLGPRMAADALAHLAQSSVHVHYVSNPDAWALYSVLRGLNAQRTLFIVSSKTLTTQETLTNAASATRWLTDNGCPAQSISQHLVAITASPAQAAQMGYAAERTFLFWDWVGGRYSLWSAIGLSIAIAIGYDNFVELLTGAHDIDEHFRTTPFAQNVPVIMGLLGIWYNNFFGAQSHAILPYDQYLEYFAAYFQQGDMESNGKSV
ncbi:MAG: glucose-6-phosphate isomerase, partial [Polaromonas sp.]